MIETEELVCTRIHMPYPNVRIPANMRIAIGPPELAEALCRRGFFERVSPEILQKEREADAKTAADLADEKPKKAHKAGTK